MTDPLSIIPGPIVQKILNDVTDFGAKEYHRLYSVRDEIDTLTSNLTVIQAVLADAEHFIIRPRQLTDWLTKIRVAALNVEDTLEMYATEAALRDLKRWFNPFSWFLSQRRASKEISDIVRNMRTIASERQNYHFRREDYGGVEGIDLSREERGMRERNPRVRNEIVGRKSEKEEIVKWLCTEEDMYDGGVPVLAITGMGGLGKTTLAQVVFNDPDVKGVYFKNAVWVNVSVEFQFHRIVGDIAYSLANNNPDVVIQGTSDQVDEEEATNNRQEARTTLQDRRSQQDQRTQHHENTIHKILNDNKPLLLVLDDVWVSEKLDWESLHSFLKTCPRGTKVLVTSRSEGVQDRMNAKMCALSALPEDKCWELFEKELLVGGTRISHDEKMVEIGKEIIRKCECLPLAVKAMASILRGARNAKHEHWERILKNGVWETDTAETSTFIRGASYILPALRLSYDYLPSSLLKQCFAYNSIFPKGYMFDKKELIKLWIVEGYLPKPSGSDTLEEVGGDFFDELLDRSFFQILEIDSKTRYKMHDLIHDLAKTVARESHQGIEDMTKSIIPSCRHVSLLCQDVQSLDVQILKVKKLRTLLLPVIYDRDFASTLKKMFQTLRYMRVLDLSSSKLIHLPKSIKNLKLLHYLNLSRTEIRLLPITICQLLNLQILKLIGCTSLQKLPKRLGNLKLLRYLELDETFWYNRFKLPSRLEALTNLHTLPYFPVHPNNGLGIEVLKNMNSIEGVLHISNLENSTDANNAQLESKSGITKLILEWSNDDSPKNLTAQENVLDNLRPHNGLEELDIQHYKGSILSGWLGDEAFSKLHKLSLTHCVNCRTLSLGLLPNLKQLIIQGMSELEEWADTTTSTSYKSLTSLTISNCPKIQTLPRSDFSSLDTFVLEDCPKLEAMPEDKILHSLKILRIQGCPLLTIQCNKDAEEDIGK